MGEPLDELYLKWLYRQVASISLRNPARTYWSLLRHLYVKEFVWIIPNDDNRVEDGRDLRYEFLEEKNLEHDEEWLGLGCSFLEMLIGLSRRLAFEAEGKPREWFWILLDNLSLIDYTDDYCSRLYDYKELVDEIVDGVIWRTYYPDGRGGLFPLQNATEDQRDVEIWYQLGSFLLELE